MFKKTVVHFLSVGNHEISEPESGRFVPRRFVPKVEMIRTQR